MQKIISKWLLPNEIGILTTGLKKITYENLIVVTRFSRGNDIIINFFKRYLQEASENILSGFVKFTTGTSILIVIFIINFTKIILKLKKDQESYLLKRKNFLFQWNFKKRIPIGICFCKKKIVY